MADLLRCSLVFPHASGVPRPIFSECACANQMMTRICGENACGRGVKCFRRERTKDYEMSCWATKCRAGYENVVSETEFRGQVCPKRSLGNEETRERGKTQA